MFGGDERRDGEDPNTFAEAFMLGVSSESHAETPRGSVVDRLIAQSAT